MDPAFDRQTPRPSDIDILRLRLGQYFQGRALALAAMSRTKVEDIELLIQQEIDSSRRAEVELRAIQRDYQSLRVKVDQSTATASGQSAGTEYYKDDKSHQGEIGNVREGAETK